jgi:hypothetical protein
MLKVRAKGPAQREAMYFADLLLCYRESEAHQDWERQALVDLRSGKVAQAVPAYDAHDRIVVAEKASSARQALIEQWWKSAQGGNDGDLGRTRGDVAALNLKARERRREAGELRAEIRLAVGKAFAVGDRIIFEKNARADLADRNQEGRGPWPSATGPSALS